MTLAETILFEPGLGTAVSHLSREPALRQTPETEWMRFESARDKVLVRIAALGSLVTLSISASKSSSASKESNEVIGLLAFLADDPQLAKCVNGFIFNDHRTAIDAVGMAFTQLKAQLSTNLKVTQGTEHIAEKSADLDACADLYNEGFFDAKCALSIANESAPLFKGRIVLAPFFTTSDCLQLALAGAAGLVCTNGSPASHFAILARSLNLPAVIVTPAVYASLNLGQFLAMDATRGLLFPNPDVLMSRSFEARRAYEKILGARCLERAALPAQTKDGHTIPVRANIDSSESLHLIRASGSCGVGLFRLESFFLRQTVLPTEDQIFAELHALTHALPDEPITVRLVDVSEDKPIACLALSSDVGWEVRGVRYLLSNPQCLDSQLRAAVRANRLGNLRVLVPFVSEPNEMWEVHARLLAAWKSHCDAVGKSWPRPKLGMMVETPAAALSIDLYAGVAEFLSIGTNDLTQFTFARPRITKAHSECEKKPELTPLLRLLANTIVQAKRHKIPVAVCGELAADPTYATLFIGLGVDELSCNLQAVPTIKECLRSIHLSKAKIDAQNAIQPREPKMETEVFTRENKTA